MLTNEKTPYTAETLLVHPLGCFPTPLGTPRAWRAAIWLLPLIISWEKREFMGDPNGVYGAAADLEGR